MNNQAKHIVKEENFKFGEAEEDRLELDCGQRFGPINVCYETYGSLDESGSNAILILHALTGDAHVSGYHHADDAKPGWWDEMVGPGRWIDTEQYFVVCSNILGGCSGTTGPRSINPNTGQPYNLSFPVITIGDMVKTQFRLMQHLKITKWLAVIGGSMGGMQALEWAVRYPDAVASVIPIATTARLSPQGIAFDWVGRRAIIADARWRQGNYRDEVPEEGLSTARMLAHITYLSDESMSNKFGRSLQDGEDYSFGFERDFAVESYLQYQGQRFVERFDANSYLYITRAVDYFDIAVKSNGNLAEALSQVRAKFLVVAFSSDWLFPPAQSHDIVNALLHNEVEVSYCEVQSSYGHDAFLLEVDTLGRMIADFIRNRYLEVKDD